MKMIWRKLGKVGKKRGYIIATFLLTIFLYPCFTTQASNQFGPRLTEPDYSNPYYHSNINPFWNYSYLRMPNCTTYAWGRAYEILGSRPGLSTGMAYKWFNENRTYETGREPKLGAIACWGQDKYGSGHVAVVEEINGDNITVSESGYGNFYFKTSIISSDGRYKTNFSAGGPFQGYIYIGDFSNETETEVEMDTDAPVISDVQVYDVDENGYSIRCRVTDNVGVLKVQFPTWTVYNGQDDMLDNWDIKPEASGAISGNTVTYRVNRSDHNGEFGDYETHIYAFDAAGNESFVEVYQTIKDKGIPVQSISLNLSNLELRIGQEYMLSVNYEPEDTTDKADLVWSSADPGIVKVNNGKLVAKSEGETLIFADVNGKVATCFITVIDDTDESNDSEKEEESAETESKENLQEVGNSDSGKTNNSGSKESSKNSSSSKKGNTSSGSSGSGGSSSGSYKGNSGLDISWKRDQNGWWAQRSNGTYPKSEWQKINNAWYYFGNSGYMETGWQKINNIWYFLNADGSMISNNWTLQNNKWYFMNADGSMKTGWLDWNQSWYYLNSNGEMLMNAATPDGYYVDGNGKWIK